MRQFLHGPVNFVEQQLAAVTDRQAVAAPQQPVLGVAVEFVERKGADFGLEQVLLQAVDAFRRRLDVSRVLFVVEQEYVGAVVQEPAARIGEKAFELLR